MALRVSPTRLLRQRSPISCDAPLRFSPDWRVSSALRPRPSWLSRALPFSSSRRRHQDAAPIPEEVAKPQAARAVPTKLDSTIPDASKSEPSGSSKRSHRKKRAPATKAPLAKIAKDAEVSHLHGLVHGSRGRDPKVKHVIAYCVAEEYDLVNAEELLKEHGMPIGPCGRILYPEEPQVIHVDLTYPAEFQSRAPDARIGSRQGDIFIFPSGVVVSWGVPSARVKGLIETLRPAARGELGDNADTEDLEYLEDDNESKSAVRNERIVLGVRPVKGEVFEGVDPAEHTNDQVHTVLAKIAFSSGLARATKVSVLENKVEDYIDSTRGILDILRLGQSFLFRSRKGVYSTIAQLLDLRAQLNLYSELTDDLPDLLWESRPELRMESYYDQVGRVFATGARIRSLNQRMDYSASIVHALRDMRSEAHSSFLEKIIILLIAFEILMSLRSEYRDLQRQESVAPRPTETGTVQNVR